MDRLMKEVNSMEDNRLEPQDVIPEGVRRIRDGKCACGYVAKAGDAPLWCDLPADHGKYSVGETRHGCYVNDANGVPSWRWFPSETVNTEAVNHPSHYGGDSTYEHIKVVEAWGLNYALGNCTKYICRAGKKNADTELEDLEKALWYLQHEVDRVKKERF